MKIRVWVYRGFPDKKKAMGIQNIFGVYPGGQASLVALIDPLTFLNRLLIFDKTSFKKFRIILSFEYNKIFDSQAAEKMRGEKWNFLKM